MRLHSHLRDWRKHRSLTQEAVAASLGVRHTTIGRWELGKMKLAATDLERLAALYGASVSQLQGPPAAATLIARLDRTQKIVERMSADDLEKWLALGEALIRP